jgi:hypothetical protein
MAWTDKLTDLKKIEEQQKAQHRQKINELCNALTPTVERVLNELGLALWGRGGRNFTHYHSITEWPVHIWSIKKSKSGITISAETTGMQGFRISVNNGIGECAYDFTDNCSEQSLKDGLVKACHSAQKYNNNIGQVA